MKMLRDLRSFNRTIVFPKNEKLNKLKPKLERKKQNGVARHVATHPMIVVPKIIALILKYWTLMELRMAKPMDLLNFIRRNPLEMNN